MSSSSSVVPSSAAGESSISGGFQFRQATVSELENRIRDQQGTILDLESNVRRLQQELANVKMRLINKKGTSNISDCSPEIILTKNLHRLGKYHQIFYSIVVSPEWFGKLKPSFDHDNSIIRYLNAENIKLGHTAKLYSCFPAQYHSIISEDSMSVAISAFMKGVSKGRSTALNKIRSSASVIFPKINPSYLISSSDSSKSSEVSRTRPVLSELPEVQRLLGAKRVCNPAKPVAWMLCYKSSNIEIFPPVLYANNDCNDALGLFKSDQIIMVAKIIIAGGPSALKGPMPKNRDDSPLYHMDKCSNCTTPGLIAWAATATIYMISDDTEFTGSGVGAKSGRPYHAHYDIYKRYLISQHSSLSSLFSFWNAAIFPHQQPLAEAMPLTSQPTLLISEDLVQDMISRFNRQSTIHPEHNPATDDEDEDDIEEFQPAVSTRSICRTPSIEESDGSDDIHTSNLLRQQPSLLMLPLSASHTAAAMDNQPDSALPTTPVAPVTPHLSHTYTPPSTSDTPRLPPPPATKKKTGKTALQADTTIVPTRTRNTRANTRAQKSKGN